MNKVVPDEEDPLLKHYRYTRTEKVFDRLDVGGNGSISFAEYLTQVDNLEQDEIQAARAAFELLGPDINGDVKKRKFIALQISSFEDVAEPEFNRWVHIMTKGSVVHSHKRKDLLASGIQVPDDYVEPRNYGLFSIVSRLSTRTVASIYNYFTLEQKRRQEAAYKKSLGARNNHVSRLKLLKKTLAESDKTMLDLEHEHAITQLENKAKSKQRQHMFEEVFKVKAKKEPEVEPVETRKTKASKMFNETEREEKRSEETPSKGNKNGSCIAPLMYERSNKRIIHSEKISKKLRENRLGSDLNKRLTEEIAEPVVDEYAEEIRIE